MFKGLRRVFLEVIGDFGSCIYHANDLLINSSNNLAIIFFIVFLAFFFSVVFASGSKIEFYVNFSRDIFVGAITYFIFCLSNYFWFLKNKLNAYSMSLNNKECVDLVLKKAKTIHNLSEDINIKGQLLLIVLYYSSSIGNDAKRYLVEICVLLIILFNVAPVFFILNIVLFWGMSYYVPLYERESTTQAFADVFLIVNCLKKLIKDDPDECKKYILENKFQGIKDLEMLYKAIAKTHRK